MLLRWRCPRGGAPARPWYVPGAVARCSAVLLRELWCQAFPDVEAPSERCIRSHLGALEGACVIARQPGELLPAMPEWQPEQRPRHADTIHVLDTWLEAEWWSGPGAAALREHPEARRSARAWRQLFEGWRERAARGELFAPQREKDVAPSVRTGELVAAAVREHSGDVISLVSALRAAGVDLEIHGQRGLEMVREPRRLAGAAALLARALLRGDRVRSSAAWLARAWATAPRSERGAALDRVLHPLRARGRAAGQQLLFEPPQREAR